MRFYGGSHPTGVVTKGRRREDTNRGRLGARGRTLAPQGPSCLMPGRLW